MLRPAEEGPPLSNSGPSVPVPDIDDSRALDTNACVLSGAPGEAYGGPLKRAKPGGEGPVNGSGLLAVEASTRPSAPTEASEVISATTSKAAVCELAAMSASEAAVGATDASAAGAATGGGAAATPEGGALSRNRMNSGRHGERIACPMDGSHSIYALRLQAHLKKCTKARDIAFSHCLPFMQPGINLPQQQQHERQAQQQQPEQQQGHQQQQQHHAGYIDNPETAAALTPEFEAKISEAYRYAMSYLHKPPIEAAATTAATTASPAARAEAEATVVPCDSLEELPASLFMSNCCRSDAGRDNGKRQEEALLLLRAAADACTVPLETGTAAAKGPPLASLEAELKKALLLPQQDQLNALLQVLRELQQRLNKHQKQLLQLLALCLLHRHLQHSSLDETLIVELGAGKGDLTRWLCCWSAVAVAAAAPREPAAAAIAGAPCVPAHKQHRGVRCIVVDREARRYCKEAKDKTFRNPNAPRPLHHAAIAAAERRKAAAGTAVLGTAMEGNGGLRNPLLGEEEAAGATISALKGAAHASGVDDAAVVPATGSASQAPDSLRPAVFGVGTGCSNADRNSSNDAVLPVPPVRLRMDIADFSLVALVKYITCNGPLRVPHIPGFFKRLFEYGCRFAAPATGLEQEGAHETNGGSSKANEGGNHSLAKAAGTSGVTREKPAGSAMRGPKPRLLRCFEDGSVEDFFAITKTLGEGGGPNMEKWGLLLLVLVLPLLLLVAIVQSDEKRLNALEALASDYRIDYVLKEHFRGRCTSRMLCVGKRHYGLKTQVLHLHRHVLSSSVGYWGNRQKARAWKYGEENFRYFQSLVAATERLHGRYAPTVRRIGRNA
ncbi:hypothetical protein, conserved [Eimeria brunetti]|uniref:tRNA:m(4)X modification enzyme TRM13 n=1 Tax=Eimeria brunetti TaxID=51314 RepID=U6LKN6_9EIME|nr:hypothetical protein, conserved [Eimeria brunetti]